MWLQKFKYVNLVRIQMFKLGYQFINSEEGRTS